ncbi:MAG TPA: 3-hydroxyacyl-CoA dehydrogenase NAD-binding domain-containing protein [Terriglobales bacterium]|nr:3-hydroxyacyl-CoA dehydrogenase NAD-binding domain-containing protein [Terriglobales bacterium]
MAEQPAEVPTHAPVEAVTAVHTIAVIGAGVTGRSIAQAMAVAGFRTILEDLLPNALRKAETEIRAKLTEAVAAGNLTSADATTALSCLEYADSIEQAARAADLVIEAVPEELESKIEIFTMLDKICRPNTILVSTTSSLSVTEIASVTYRAKRCAGIRFGNRAHATTTIEVVSTPETDDDTLATVTEVARRMGKEVVIHQESSDPFHAQSHSATT